MKTTKQTPYIPPELELFSLDRCDVLTASDGENPGTNGNVSDENVDFGW